MSTTTTARRVTGAATALVIGATLTACAGREPASPISPSPATVTASPTPTASPSAPDASPTPTPEVPDDELGGFTQPGQDLTDEGAASGYVVTAVRTGTHAGYDRVVYELTGGEGVPGYRVGYVDEAVEDPSGKVRQVDGDAILQVVLIGTTYPVDGGPQEFSQDLHPADGDVEHVVRPLTFEAQTQSFIGVDDAPRPFRVTVLADPVRVVVDLQDD